MKNRAILSALLCSLLLGGVFAPAAYGREGGKHLLLLLELNGDRLKVLHSNLVNLPLPRRRGPERVLPWRITASGVKGKVLLRRYLEDPRLVRAEFHGKHPGDPIAGVTKLRQGQVAFSVRVPATGVARIVVEKLRPGLARDEAGRADAWQQVAGLVLGKAESRP